MLAPSKSTLNRGLADPRRQRSRIGNGSLLPKGLGNTAWHRRAKELISDHLSDLGGVDNSSAAERSLVRRAVVITIELERLEAKFAGAGQASDHDLDLYQRSAGNLKRLLEAVGLRRRPREVGGLSELWRADQPPPVDHDHADR